MSHVDEGMLHAYLDGGLSALDAVRVERHVADCGPCRQQLDQARALIQRAARLLEWASPPADRAAPPLADLRPAVPPRWRVPVAWAATIVIALGAGIYGGQLILSRPQETASGAAADEEKQALGDRRAPPITVVAEADSKPRRDEPKAATTPAEESSAVVNRLAQTPVAKAPADTTRPLVVVDGIVAGAARNEAPVAAADSAGAGRERERRQLAPAAAAAPAPAEPQAQARIESGQYSAARARRVAGFTTWPVITRDSAARLLQTGIVALPDVPITAVRAAGDSVVVEHVLPPGQVIRLVERRAAEGEGGAVAERSSELLARYVAGLRVEISGPFSPDSLSRLLERVRVVP